MDPAKHMFRHKPMCRPHNFQQWMLPEVYALSHVPPLADQSDQSEQNVENLTEELSLLLNAIRLNEEEIDDSNPFKLLHKSEAFQDQTAYELASINSVYGFVSPPGNSSAFMKLKILVIGSGAYGYLDYCSRRLVNSVYAVITNDIIEIDSRRASIGNDGGINGERMTMLQDVPIEQGSKEIESFLASRFLYGDLFIYGGSKRTNVYDVYDDSDLEDALQIGIRYLVKSSTESRLLKRQVPSSESSITIEDLEDDGWRWKEGVMIKEVQQSIYGGNLIMKLYESVSEKARYIIYEAAKNFEWITLMKPCTSHPLSPTIYLIGHNRGEYMREDNIPQEFDQWLDRMNTILLEDAVLSAESLVYGDVEESYDVNAYLNFLELPGAV